jgi:hypothetical protein
MGCRGTLEDPLQCQRHSLSALPVCDSHGAQWPLGAQAVETDSGVYVLAEPFTVVHLRMKDLTFSAPRL